MHSIAITACISCDILWISLFAAHSLAMRRDGRYRQSWGAACIALVPALLPVVWLTVELELSMEKRNVILGSIGALGGMVLTIWIGYFFHDIYAKSDSPGVSSPTSDKPFNPLISLRNNNITTPNNSGIVTYGQTGNNTLINQVPIPRSLSSEQAGNLARSLRGSGISVLITSPSDPEVLAYQQQIVLALQNGGIKTRVFNISTLSPPIYGIEIR